MNNSFLLIAFFSVSFLAIDVSPLYSQNENPSVTDSIYYKNPEYFIARKVLDNKIVMLGDSPHHNSDSYGTLLKVLNALADEVSSKNAVSTNIKLILEMGQQDAEILNNYIKSGSPDKITELISQGYYEDLEYYSNLRKFCTRINDVNFEGKLNIKVEGFEPMNYNPGLDVIKETPWQLDSTFLLRDSILSERITNFIHKNPDSKIIMFYGNGHLQKGLSVKQGRTGEYPGYYMADGLKRNLGDDKVITFNQKDGIIPEFFRGSVLAEAEFSDIVAPCNNLDTARFGDVNKFDYCVYWKNAEDNGAPHRFDLVFSKRNVERNIEELKYYLQYSDNEQVKSYNNSFLFYLNFITCNNLKSPEEALNWDGAKNYNAFDILNSECFKNKIYEVYAHSKSKQLLNIIGFSEKDIEPGNVTDTLKRFNEIWDANLKSIKFINEIGVLWIGYPDEQIKAKEYLTQYSGKEFDDPADYLDWYRKQQKK